MNITKQNMSFLVQRWTKEKIHWRVLMIISFLMCGVHYSVFISCQNLSVHYINFLHQKVPLVSSWLYTNLHGLRDIEWLQSRRWSENASSFYIEQIHPFPNTREKYCFSYKISVFNYLTYCRIKIEELKRKTFKHLEDATQMLTIKLL